MQIKNIWIMTDKDGQVSINAQIEIEQHIFVRTIRVLKGESIWAYAS